MKYSPHILRMQTFEGFYDKWCSLLGYYNTNEQAYDAAERIYIAHFGQSRWKNFESFKVRVSQHFGKEIPAEKHPKNVRPKVEAAKKRRTRKKSKK